MRYTHRGQDARTTNILLLISVLHILGISCIKIQRLNIKANKKSYSINIDDWEMDLENAFKDAIFEASVEVKEGVYKPHQLRQIVDKVKIIHTPNRLINLTYNYSREDLRDVLDDEFCKLPGGEDWNFK